MAITESGVDVENLKAKEGWVGNVQYRPYTATGPVVEKPEQLRAVTLFDLEDFVQLARQKDKHVILIARPCARCGRTRAKALRYLLQVKALKVWSEIVMDVATARELLSGKS